MASNTAGRSAGRPSIDASGPATDAAVLGQRRRDGDMMAEERRDQPVRLGTAGDSGTPYATRPCRLVPRPPFRTKVAVVGWPDELRMVSPNLDHADRGPRSTTSGTVLAA